LTLLPTSTPIRSQSGWPNGAKVAVALSFDVDAEIGWLCEGAAYQRRLTTMSESRFGITRGVPRILKMLAARDLPATFVVPGDTADRHADAIRTIADAGHEIAHHGYDHLRSDKISAQAQREEIERGFDCFERLGLPRPVGYRSPAWELTPETFDLLIEFGFSYDSSAMGDDRPYYETFNGKKLLELPVHWALDDWSRFGWNIDSGGVLGSPAAMAAEWLDDLDFMAGENQGCSLIITMHPEMIGRAYRFEHLQRWVDSVRERDDVWFTSLSGMAAHVDAQHSDRISAS
jgi:peptidoglycan-N-acetylglucosamine deacetylase